MTRKSNTDIHYGYKIGSTRDVILVLVLVWGVSFAVGAVINLFAG